MVVSGSEMSAKMEEGSWFAQFGNGCNPWMARCVYGSFFLVANFLAWAIRDYGYTTFKSMPRPKDCSDERHCLDTEGVLRVSLGCCMFYWIMFATTVGTSKMIGRREKWQSEWWIPKTVMMLALILLPFAFPSIIISIYGKYIALYGAGVFLLIQLVSMITFINWVNDKCYHKNSTFKRSQRRVISRFTHILCVLYIAFLYVWFVPHKSCMHNFSIISGTLVLHFIMTIISCHPKMNAGSLSSGLMGLYVIFICSSALKSEPEEKCMRKGGSDNYTSKVDVLTIISFVGGFLAMVYATFSTGIDSQCFAVLKREDQKEKDDVPYGYGFFHFVFATGSMYSAMLLVGWNTYHPMQKFTIDMGWTSTYVRIIYECLAVFVYVWLLKEKRSK